MPITFLDDKKEQPGNGITFLDNADSAGISFLDAGRNATGEEVTNRQASNPASAELMNRDDYVRMLEYKRDNPVSWGTIAMQGAEGLIDVAGGAIKEIGGATLDAFNAPAPKGSISQLGVADLSRLNPVGEAAARGAYAGFNQLAGMALDMMTWNDDDLISYPQYLSANNLSDSAENKQKHELELNKQFEEFKRSQFAKAQTKDILEKSPLPATSEAVSLFAQPEFGIGALMGMGAKLRVGRAAAEAGSVVGEATQKLGKGLTTLSEMPKKLAVATAEELTGNPRVASRVGSAVQTGTTGAFIAGMGGYAIPGVYEASKLITATKIAGEVLDVVGEVTKKISESAKAGTGRIGAFEALSQDLGASSSARTIGKIATLGGVDSITPYMSAALQGAAGGAVVGGTLGFLADGGEGMAAGVGMGLTLGAGGGLAGRGLQVASGAQRRSQIINDATKGVLNLSGTSQVNAAKLFDSLIKRDGQEAVAELIDTTKWLNGAVKFEYITNEQAKSMPEARGVGFEGITVAPKKGEAGTPTVFINVDLFNPGTGFHEGFHGAMRTALGDVYAPKFNELISKSFSQKEINDFVSGYINRAEDPAVKDVLKSYLEKKGNLPEEIGAEYFRQFLQQKENRDILLRGQRTTSGALINATKSAIDFSLNRLGVTQESYKTGYKGMDKLVTELIGARTAINKSIAKSGVPLAEVPLMKMPAEQVAAWAKAQGQSDVLLKDDAGNVIGVKTEDQVNLQRDLANTKAAADLADVPRGKNNLTDAELAVYQKYLPPEHFARLVYIVDAIKTGKVINGDYFPATSKEGETSVYASRGMTTRDFVPYGIKVSKAGAISVMGLDMTQLRARFDDYMSRPGVDKLWDGNRDAALRDVQLYAENLSKGDAAVPSEQLFGKNKRDVIYKIFGFAPTKAILKSGGLVNPSSLGTNVRAESSAGPMQIGKPIDAYSNDTRLTTSFRLDRLGRVSDIGQSFQFNEGGSYKLSQVNFQVAEKIGSGEVWRSKDDQYKIIVKGNKHIVYNGNDKVGIFGNLADASSKIYKAEAISNKLINQSTRISVSDPKIVDGIVTAPESGAFKFTKDIAANFMPADSKVKLDDYADRIIIALAADRMGVGPAEVGPLSNRKTLSVPTQGGREFMKIFNGGGWAFTNIKTSDTFLSRLRQFADRNGNTIVGVTILNEINHLNNRVGQLAYVETLQAAIEGGVVSKSQADAHIKEISRRIGASKAGPKSLPQSTRDLFSNINDLDSLVNAVINREVNFNSAAWLVKKAQAKTLPISYNESTAMGMSVEQIARGLTDKELLDIPSYSVVALMEVNVNQKPDLNNFHHAYPVTVHGKTIGFLDKFYNLADLSTEPKIRNESGAVTAQPVQNVMPVMDNIRNTIETKKGIPSDPAQRGEVNFMPADSAASESKFYSSRIISAVENSSQGKANGSQWKATIKNSKLGVNQDEYALTRVEDLEAGKTYTKAEVLDYLRANQVVVKDVTLGGREQAKQWEPFNGGIRRKIGNRWTHIWSSEDGTVRGQGPSKYIRNYNSMDEAKAYYDSQDASASSTPTHFSRYTLPGAKEGSYREVLLTVPAKNPGKIVDHPSGEGYAVQLAGGKLLTNEMANEVGAPPSSNPDGIANWVLEMDAIQYALPAYDKTSWRDGHSQYSDIPNPIVRLRTNERTTADGKRMLFIEEIQAPQKKQFEKMPALFQKNWRDIAFKWSLRTAADNGFDSVGWTTGEQQAARYNLSQQVDQVTYLVDAKTLYATKGKNKNKRYVIDQMVVAPDKLHEVIGKAAAEKLLNNPTGVFKTNGAHYLSGLDLKVGGEGLKKLYDQDFHNVVNNLPIVKKSGQKVRTELVDTGELVHAINVTPEMRNASVSFMPADGKYDANNDFFFQEEKKKAIAKDKTNPIQPSKYNEDLFDDWLNTGKKQWQLTFDEFVRSWIDNHEQKSKESGIKSTLKPQDLLSSNYFYNKHKNIIKEALNLNFDVPQNVVDGYKNSSKNQPFRGGQFMPAMQFSAPENLPNGKVWRGENGYAIIQKEGGKFRVHSPIGLIGIAASYEAAEKMANKRNTK